MMNVRRLDDLRYAAANADYGETADDAHRSIVVVALGNADDAGKDRRRARKMCLPSVCVHCSDSLKVARLLALRRSGGGIDRNLITEAPVSDDQEKSGS